jgi:hypothetical protein
VLVLFEFEPSETSTARTTRVRITLAARNRVPVLPLLMFGVLVSRGAVDVEGVPQVEGVL